MGIKIQSAFHNYYLADIRELENIHFCSYLSTIMVTGNNLSGVADQFATQYGAYNYATLVICWCSSFWNEEHVHGCRTATQLFLNKFFSGLFEDFSTGTVHVYTKRYIGLFPDFSQFIS